jgi:hypothetical protein
MTNFATEEADIMEAMNKDGTCIWILGSHAI